MKSQALIRPQEELELKLALPESDTASLKKRLAGTTVLARRRATHLELHNIYFDTPEQSLRQKRVALRLRRVGSDTKPEWLQTLKMGGSSDSALSRRGEWETPVPGAALDLVALEATPWSSIDPHGSVLPALAPCFVTSFERTSWTVRKRDGSVVEVSLDIGHATIDDKSVPFCELELELLAGEAATLFDLAQQIARSIAVIPEHRSKAERGYALAQDALNLPVRAQPPRIDADMPVAAAAQLVLREMFCQFTANLNALRNSDDPEVVHQARVGWRRFRSACRLFKPVLDPDAVPSWQSLQTLLTFLGELRDLDVARTETLPQFASAYTAGNASREEKWQAMAQALTQAAQIQRKAVRYALQTPAVGASLLAITQWLEELPGMNKPGDARGDRKLSLRPWARHRVAQLHERLKAARRETATPESQHRARILAKRLRYGIEALQTLLNRRRTQHWCQQAIDLQTSIGMARDVVQAAALVGKLDVDRELAEFLRGVAAGQERRG
ncbi:MAG: CHAD domain-containing protein [Polaromonas sp.]